MDNWALLYHLFGCNKEIEESPWTVNEQPLFTTFYWPIQTTNPWVKYKMTSQLSHNTLKYQVYHTYYAKTTLGSVETNYIFAKK